MKRNMNRGARVQYEIYDFKGFFCLFLSLSQRWNLAALLINHYLISNDWDIKVGRASILLLSGSILQDNSEIEHSVGRKI